MFAEFQKIARLSRDCVVTEKIDGTNAQVHILGKLETGYAERMGLPVIAENDDAWMFAGSRTRYITPSDDNHGFAKWVQANAETLWQLGHGVHYGEWWGSGIQRGYGLQKGEKRFSLFNTARWTESRPECCGVVPVLYTGMFDTREILRCVSELRADGSKAAPGFMKPEGVVVWHDAARVLFKKTLDKDDEYKGKQKEQ